jgi:amino acid adenylation domain-containing protein
LEPNNSFYNMPAAFHLKGTLDLSAIENSINEIVRRHEILRTTFEVNGGRPVQKINPTEPVKIPVIDLREKPAGERSALAQSLAVEERNRPFDLSKGPMLRTSLIRLEEDEHILLMTLHHIASDGWSTKIFVQELKTLYSSFISGKTSPLDELPIQYADFAVWQRKSLSGKMLDEHLAYWKTRLEGLPPMLELPSSHPRPKIQSLKGATATVFLPKEMSDGLKGLMQQEGVTLFMALLAGFQVLLYRYTGQHDIAVGVPIANRSLLEVEGLIGFFVNTLVMRTDLSGQPSFQTLVKQVREVALGAYAHQGMPFDKLVEELQPERSLSHSPLFQVMFSLQNTPREVVELAHLTMTKIEVETTTAKFDLSLVIDDKPEGLKCEFNYSTDVFDESAIRRMGQHYEMLLRAIISDPQQPISCVQMLTQAEKDQVLVEWNNTKKDYPQDRHIHEFFESQVERTPDSVAVTFEGQKLTYSELNARANQLAHFLQSLGVGPEGIVGICVERSPEMIIGLLGILKAGGAYMPLDPMYPKDRLAVMLEGANTKILLTQQRLVDDLPANVDYILCLDSDSETIAKYDQSNPTNHATLDNLIAVLQTSGSTGSPKGTMVTGRGFLNLCLWYQAYCRMTQETSSLLMMTFSFDAAFKNIMTPLISGGKVVLANPGFYDAQTILKAIAEEKVTLINTTPSQMYPVIDLDAVNEYKSLSSLQRLILGGEPTYWPKLRRWVNSGHCNCRFENMYGPAECSDVLSIYQISRKEMSDSETMPIGMPISNACLYVMDANYNLQPIGIPGELCAEGDVLARGYLNHAALTAEVFVPIPFKPGRRMYWTGDLARLLDDGNIELLGRIDQQVKIRGQRVELGEIESTVNQHPGVRDSVVIAREDAPGDKRLVAYVVAHQEAAIDVNELKSFLRSKLPEYMVPHGVMLIESIPLLPNGKVNRRELQAPDWDQVAAASNYIAPRTEVEEVLAGIWAEVLGVERVGVYDDFFVRGGHSLLATQLISRVCRVFDITISLRSLFEKRTLAEMAFLVEEIIIREIAQVQTEEAV